MPPTDVAPFGSPSQSGSEIRSYFKHPIAGIESSFSLQASAVGSTLRGSNYSIHLDAPLPTPESVHAFYTATCVGCHASLDREMPSVRAMPSSPHNPSGRERIGTVPLRPRELHMGCECTVKLIKLSSDQERQELLSLQRLCGVDHEYLARVYDVGCDASGELGWIALEPCNSVSLLTLVRDFTSWNPGAKLSESDVSSIVWALASAVKELHAQGLFPRDVSAHNLLVAADGTIKLSDFGLDKSATVRKGLQAPEVQSDPEECADLASAAVWSIGCILWELSQCRRGISSSPFGQGVSSATLDEIKHIVKSEYQTSSHSPMWHWQHDLMGGDGEPSSALRTLLTGMLAFDPAQRPSIVQVMQELEEIYKLPLGKASSMGLGSGEYLGSVLNSLHITPPLAPVTSRTATDFYQYSTPLLSVGPHSYRFADYNGSRQPRPAVQCPGNHIPKGKHYSMRMGDL